MTETATPVPSPPPSKPVIRESRTLQPKPLQRKSPEGMRTFTMYREEASGKHGIILEGVIFSTGMVIVHWLTPPPRGSINLFDQFSHFKVIHAKPMAGNKTIITFNDGEQLRM